MTKKVLGRGLRALIPPPEQVRGQSTQLIDAPTQDEAVESHRASGGIESLLVSSIRRNPDQPRRYFDDDALESLATSIRLHGILQPILVRQVGPSEYELVAGERRWLACQRAGIGTIPAHVRDVPDESLLETALVENIQRQDLNPIEEAEAYKRLIEEWRLTQSDVSLRVGKDRSSIANCLRLLSLPASVKELVSSGRLSEGHGRAIVSLGSEAAMTGLATRVLESGISVRQTEAMARELIEEALGGAAVKRKAREQPKTEGPVRASDPHVRALADELTSALSTRVTIDMEHGGKGRISIEFYSVDDLGRIADAMLNR